MKLVTSSPGRSVTSLRKLLSSSIDELPQSLNLTWLPRVDGTFLTDLPQQLVLQGSVADIPFVTGVR